MAKKCSTKRVRLATLLMLLVQGSARGGVIYRLTMAMLTMPIILSSMLLVLGMRHLHLISRTKVAVLSAKRLNSSRSLTLVRACS